MSASSRPAASRRFRSCPLAFALACAFSGGAWAVPTDIPVATDVQFLAALRQVAGPTTCDPNGSRIIASGTSFTVSVATPLPTIGCPNVEIAGNGNITVSGTAYGGACGLNAAPTAGLTRISGVTVRNFTAGASGMCGKLEATGNTVVSNDKGFTLNGGAILSGNTIAANATWGVGDTGTGSTLSQNVIDGNGYGIYAANAMTVDRNSITGNAGTGVYGLDGMIITGNTITGNGRNGVDVFDGATITGNVIANNGSGIDAGAGSAIKGNTVRDHLGEGTGINLFDGGTIGGSGAGEGNVIYNNAVDIYAYTGTSYGGTLAIVNNLVGTPDGQRPGSSGYGINVYYQAAPYNISGNVISGHARGPGLRINFAAAAGTVSGNMVGVNASGSAAIANQGAGIELYNLSGPVTLSGNVISGNVGPGVDVWQSPGVVLNGNKIGTDASGTAGIGNASGIAVASSSNSAFTGNVVAHNRSSGIVVTSSSNNTYDDNVVAYNLGDGILVWTGVGNAIRGGSIHSNTGKNINLDFPGAPRPNDALDADVGPNGLQNYPDITSAVVDSGDTVVQFTLQSTPGTSFDIHFYSNSAAGVHAGETFVSGDVMTVTTNASGIASGSRTLAGSRTNVTTTATGPSGTSEFSAPIAPLVPAVSILPSTISFGNVVVGATSPAQEVTFTSTGTGPYVLDSLLSATTLPACPGSGVSICASGDFSCATNCVPGTPYATTNPQTAACKITGITFHPLATGPQANTIYVCDNTSATARAITLSGTGVPITLSAAPASYNFGNVVLGSRALSPPIVISNPTAAAANILSSVPSGPFTIESSTCASTLPPAASCSVTMAYQPAALATHTGSLTVNLGNFGNPVVVPLSGTGIPVTLSVAPASYNFGNVELGTRALSPPIVISNPTTATASLLSSVASGPFTIASTTCASTLPPGASCSFTMAYQPSALAAQTGSLTVSLGNLGTPVVVPLSGTGQATVGQLTLPSTIDLGTAVLLANPLQHSLELRNVGNIHVEFVLIAATPPFAVSHNCPASLAPGAACVANVSLQPLLYGLFVGQLTVLSNAEGTGTITLLASVSGVPYALSPSEASFGQVHTGTRSPARTFVLANNGDNPVPLSGVSVSAPFTIVTNTCGASLGARSACAVEVAFEPVQAGGIAGWLTAEIGIPGAPRAESLLSGTGIQQPALVLPESIDFGSVVLGSVPSVTQTLQLRNTGNALLTFTASASGPFVLSGDCQGTLLAAGACNLVITFTPAVAGEFRGALAIVSNAPGGSRSIGLSVRVRPRVAPFLQTSPTFVGFGERIVGTLGATQRITITNDGGSDAVLGPVTAGADFVVTSHCGSLLAPAASCAVDVAMRPLGFGLRSGQLHFTSNATGSPHVVELQGTGCRPFTIFSARYGLRSSCAP